MKNIKLITLILSVCVVFGIFPPYSFAKVLDGSKSAPEKDENGAYIITNAEELAWFSDNASFAGSSANAVLEADIDLSGSEWTPIGKTSDSVYSGTFNGNGHTVSGLKVTNSAYAGLFGYISGTVSNLTVTGEITYNGYSTSYAGGIAGYNKGTIENCVSDITVSGKSTSGGIAGTNDGIILCCINKGSISSSSNDVGGIAGVNLGGEISLCANRAAIISAASNAYAGGIAGRVQGSSAIKNVYNTGNVSGRYAGGIAGYVYSSSAVINNAYSTGAIICSGSYSGGIAALMGFGVKTTKITNCYFLKSDMINSNLYAVQKAGNDREDLTGITEEKLKSPEFILSFDGALKSDNLNNPINNGYPIFAWQDTGSKNTVAIDGVILESDNADIESGHHRIDVNYNMSEDGGLLALAIYNYSGVLEKIWLAEENIISAEYDLSGGSVMKVLFWSDNFKPITQAVTINAN